MISNLRAIALLVREILISGQPIGELDDSRSRD